MAAPRLSVLHFLLADEPRLAGWQSGALRPDLTPKDSAPAFRQAIAEATGGAVACDALKGGRPSADFMPPSATTGLAGAAATEPLRVELSGTAAADDTGVTTYRVYRNGAHIGTTTATTATTSTNTSVSAGTTYTYLVRALDAAANLGDASASAQVTTPDTVLQVDLSWASSSDDVGVTGYEVLRGGVLLATVTSTSYVDGTAQQGVSYFYSVRALDAAGQSRRSGERPGHGAGTPSRPPRPGASPR